MSNKIDDNIEIEPFRRYSRKEVMAFLQLDGEQMKLAEQQRLIVFFQDYMYGIYLYQFMRDNCKRLEDLKSKIKETK
jgi:hypothetical protein